MILRRPLPLLPVSALLCLGTFWLVARRSPPRLKADELRAGRAYAVHVAMERAELDLPFDRSQRYLLIVGSLGRRIDPYEIALSAESIESAGSLSAKALEPLSQRPSGRFPRRTPQGEASHGTDNRSTGMRDERPGPACPDCCHDRRPIKREFFLHVTDGSLENPDCYARVVGRLVAEGREVRVFLDEQHRPSDLAAGLIEEIVFQFDRRLVPSFQRRLGRYRDVDGDGRFTVLLSPWLSRLQGGRTSLGGFVRISDFRGDRPPPFSNHGDMMYLNTDLQPGPHLETLLAHEYTHAVCFSERLPGPRRTSGLPDEEDWLNEALAHLSENMEGGGWSNLDYRISRFLNHPGRYPLMVDDYYGTGLWRNHGCRGATYLFLRWCVDRFGSDVLRRLVQAPRRGAGNVQWATGRPMQDLFRRWTVSLYQSSRVARPLPVEGGDERRSVAAGGRSIPACASAVDPYTSIDLRGRLQGWGLAGPRIERWNLQTKRKTVHVAGTSAVFLELRADDAVARRVRVRAELGTGLQVTLLPLPQQWPSIAIDAHWSRSDGAVSEKSDWEDCRLVVDVAGDAVQVETIACEYHDGPARESYCFSRDELPAGRHGLPAGNGTEPARFELPLALPDDATGPWIVKVVARDSQGRRATAWRTLDAPAAGGKLVRVAHVIDGRPAR